MVMPPEPSVGDIAIAEAADVEAEQVSRIRGNHLVIGSLWLLSSVALGALTGAIFWLIAARLSDSTSVGRASALFTSILFVNYATSLGLPVAATAYAADEAPESHVLFTWALVLTTGSSIVGTATYFVVVHPAAADALWQWSRPGGLLLFAIFIVGASFAVLIDVRLMAARMWGWALFRFAAVGLIRLPLVFLHPFDNEALWLFLLSAGPPCLSGLVGVALLRRRGRLHLRLGPRPSHAAAAFRYATVNYVSMLASYAPTFALPVLVLVNVSASENARFFVAWSISAVAFLMPQTIGQVLLVEGRKRHADVRAQARNGLLIAVVVMAAAFVAVVFAGPAVTALYGPEYADAAGYLRPLIAAGIPWAVTAIHLHEARVRHDTALTVGITIVLAASILVPAALLVPDDGAHGATRAWVFGQSLTAILTLAAVYLRRPSVTRPEPAPALATQ